MMFTFTVDCPKPEHIMSNDIRTASVYTIRNSKTGAEYIGSALEPFKRIGCHLRMLRKGAANRALQEAWDASVVSDWCYIILEDGILLDQRYVKEQQYIRECAPSLNTREATAFVKKEFDIKLVCDMLKAGYTYRAISKHVGCSLGRITTIKNKHLS